MRGSLIKKRIVLRTYDDDSRDGRNLILYTNEVVIADGGLRLIGFTPAEAIRLATEVLKAYPLDALGLA